MKQIEKHETQLCELGVNVEDCDLADDSNENIVDESVDSDSNEDVVDESVELQQSQHT